MSKWRNGASRFAMVMGAAALMAPWAVEAASFTVTSGTTDTTTKTVAGTDAGTVASGGTLRSTSGTATIGWNGASTGVIVSNFGTIENTGSGRVIDATGAVANRTFTFLNNVGAIVRSTQNDVFRFNLGDDLGHHRDRQCRADPGRRHRLQRARPAIDVRGMTGAASMTIINRAAGIIEALTDDAIRTGQTTVVENYGIIRSFGTNTSRLRRRYRCRRQHRRSH